MYAGRMAVELIGHLIALAESPPTAPALPIAAPRRMLAIVPGSLKDLARLEHIRQRGPINILVRGPHRSRPQENWYRALVRYVAEGLGMHPDTLHAELKFEAGKILQTLTSEKFGMAVVLKSSVHMDDAEFAAYVELATDIVFLKYLPGVRRKDVVAEVDKMVRPSRR